MSQISVFYTFVSSGNSYSTEQLLGIDPKPLVISEINPSGCFKSIAAQTFV